MKKSIRLCSHFQHSYKKSFTLVSVTNVLISFLISILLLKLELVTLICYQINFLFIVVIRQSCPLSSILFNLFINDILNNCDKYGVSICNKKCCGDLFADDIVLIGPNERKIKALLRHIFCLANKNEMSFGINKCDTIVIKPLNFVSYPVYEEPTFYLGMYSIHIYLGISFSNDLSFEPIITYMNSKVKKSLFSFSSFLSNNKVPLTFKRSIIQLYIISKVLYFAPLLGSNKNNSKNVQSLINTALL